MMNRIAQYLVPVVFLAAVPMLFWLGEDYRAELARLEADNVAGEAEVLEKRIDRSSDFGKGDTPSTSYIVRYRLVPAAGPPVEKEVAMGRDTYEQVSVGSKLALRYKPGEPALHRLEVDGTLVSGDWTYSSGTDTMVKISAAVLALLALLWLWLWPRLAARFGRRS